MAYEMIKYEVKDRIATITFNRPEKMNAWNDKQTEEVYDSVMAAEADEDVRVIIITGSGRAFSAGADVTTFGQHTSYQHLIDKQPRHFKQNERADWQTRHSYFPTVKKPIISMINGATAGLSLLYAMFSDMRFMSEDAVITTAFSRISLTAEYGSAWMLERLVGHANALDLFISGRRVKGPEAFRMGLVNQVHPADKLAEATYAYAKDIAENVSPRSASMLKQQVWDLPFQTFHEAARSSMNDMLITNASADHKEGVKAFLEKRKPVWTGK